MKHELLLEVWVVLVTVFLFAAPELIRIARDKDNNDEEDL
jgi:hypothetical protein